MYGELYLVGGRPEGTVGVIAHRESLVQLVSHGFIVWGESSSRGVEVSAKHSDCASGVNCGCERDRVGAVGVPQDFGHDVWGGGGHADWVLMFEREKARGEKATICCG
jgi:hypothetical protein